MPQYQIQRVDIEVGKPGPKGWSKAVITFNADGQVKRQNVMSFKNPAVYQAVQDYVGETVEVELTKNDKGYDEWASVKKITGAGQPAPAASAASSGNGTATRVTGSNYETPAERARRQVLIVRQSSLTAALTFLLNAGPSPDLQTVLDTAQDFVDFVFDEEKTDGEAD